MTLTGIIFTLIKISIKIYKYESANKGNVGNDLLFLQHLSLVCITLVQ